MGKGRKKSMENPRIVSMEMPSEMITRVKKAQREMIVHCDRHVSFSECVRRAVDLVYPNRQMDLFSS